MLAKRLRFLAGIFLRAIFTNVKSDCGDGPLNALTPTLVNLNYNKSYDGAEQKSCPFILNQRFMKVSRIPHMQNLF